MKSYRKELWFNAPARMHFTNITPDIRECLTESGIKEGLVLAIEPMINMGGKAVVHDRDGWTVRTADNQPSAHFEHTVAVTDSGPVILTSINNA